MSIEVEGVLFSMEFKNILGSNDGQANAKQQFDGAEYEAPTLKLVNPIEERDTRMVELHMQGV